MSFDIRFLTATPWGPSSINTSGVFLRIIQQLTGEAMDSFDDTDGSHLPMVKPVRDLQRRIETMESAASKYRSKSTEITTAMQGEMSHCDDPEVKVLTDNLMRAHHMLSDYLEGLLPILRDQRESVKQLSEYLTPPTVELFHKKVNHILKDAPLQQISKAKKNTCTICMDAAADCVIKRTCCDSGSSSYHRAHCERDTCRCGPTMCRDCLLTHYWTSTGKGSKSYARCVCCRAEFCLKDVFPVEYVEDEAYLALKSEQEKLEKEREARANTPREDEGRSRRRKHSSKESLGQTTTSTSYLSRTNSPIPAIHTHNFRTSTTSSSSPRSLHNHTHSSHPSHNHTHTSTYPPYSPLPETPEPDHEPNRKRRRTNNNSNNTTTTTTTTSTTSHNSNYNLNDTNSTTIFHNNHHNNNNHTNTHSNHYNSNYSNSTNNNNSNNNTNANNTTTTTTTTTSSSGDNDGRSKYHLRSAHRRS